MAVFLAAFFTALVALAGRLATWSVAVFLAGVRLFSPSDFCSRAMKSTTLVASPSRSCCAGSSTFAVAPLAWMRSAMMACRRSRNSSWYSSGFHSPLMDWISLRAISISLGETR